MNIRPTLSWLFLIALLWQTPSLYAQPTPTKAAQEKSRKHFATGQALVAAKDFKAAYAEFEAGYELSKRPLFLFNMAECANQEHQTEKARSAYESYLNADPNGAMAKQARERLRALGPAPTPLESPVPRASPSLRVTVDPAASSGRTDLTSPGKTTSPPIWKRWPFWAVVGGATVAGVAAIYVTRDQGSGSSSTIDWRN